MGADDKSVSYGRVAEPGRTYRIACHDSWALSESRADLRSPLSACEMFHYLSTPRHVAQRQLDRQRGFLRGGISTWIAAGFEQEHIPQVSVVELDHKLPEHPFVLDVRSPKEWSEGHIEGALHIPVGDTEAKVDKIPQGKTIYVICGSGYRSSIATSVLRRTGIAEVINVTGGMTAWNAQKLPTTRNSI